MDQRLDAFTGVEVMNLASEIQYVKGCLSGYKNSLLIIQTLSEGDEHIIRAIGKQIDVEQSILKNLEKQHAA